MDEKIYAENNNMKVKIGDNVNLLCKSYIEESMQYCRFTSPSGESFLLQPSSNFKDQRYFFDINKNKYFFI